MTDMRKPVPVFTNGQHTAPMYEAEGDLHGVLRRHSARVFTQTHRVESAETVSKPVHGRTHGGMRKDRQVIAPAEPVHRARQPQNKGKKDPVRRARVSAQLQRDALAAGIR
jgi:hypothetical protein